MNWIDFTLLALIGMGAVRGLMKGFILELCGLVGLVLGIWGAIHLNNRVAMWLGLDARHEIVSFLITFLLIVAALHVIGTVITKAIDLAQLSLPNKLGGLVMGGVRKAFLLSVMLNVLFAAEGSGWAPSPQAMRDSMLATPLRAIAPAILPALGETKWVKRAMEELKKGLHEQAE